MTTYSLPSRSNRVPVKSVDYEDLADFVYASLGIPVEMQQVTKIHVHQYLVYPDCTGEGRSRLPGKTDF